MKPDLTWMSLLGKHLRHKGELTKESKNLPEGEVILKEDILQVFRDSFAGHERAVFIDLETTGLLPTQDLVTQIAAVGIHLYSGKLETFNAYVKLPEEKAVPKDITDMTGISTELLQKAGQDEGMALASFGEWLGYGKMILAGHNIQFDLCFLFEALRRQQDECASVMEIVERADYFDTLTVYKDRRPSPHGLSAALKEYGLDYQSSHHALEDAGGALALAYFMGAEKQDLSSYINRIGINPKYGLVGYEIGKVHYYSQEGIKAPDADEPRVRAKSI